MSSAQRRVLGDISNTPPKRLPGKEKANGDEPLAKASTPCQSQQMRADEGERHDGSV